MRLGFVLRSILLVVKFGEENANAFSYLHCDCWLGIPGSKQTSTVSNGAGFRFHLRPVCTPLST
jgi:hypothetical protein